MNLDKKLRELTKEYHQITLCADGIEYKNYVTPNEHGQELHLPAANQHPPVELSAHAYQDPHEHEQPTTIVHKEITDALTLATRSADADAYLFSIRNAWTIGGNDAFKKHLETTLESYATHALLTDASKRALKNSPRETHPLTRLYDSIAQHANHASHELLYALANLSKDSTHVKQRLDTTYESVGDVIRHRST